MRRVIVLVVLFGGLPIVATGVVLGTTVGIASADSWPYSNSGMVQSEWTYCDGEGCDNIFAYWQDEPALWLHPVTGGTKIYEDYQDFYIDTSEGVNLYDASMANYTSGGAQRWYGDTSGGGLHDAGCLYQFHTPESCTASNENTNGYTFTGSWWATGEMFLTDPGWLRD